MKINNVIEIRSELGAGTRGASLGIDAVKLAAIDEGKDMLAKLPTVRVADENQLLYEPVETQHARWIRGIHQVVARTCEQVAQSLQKDHASLVMTGDHGNAAGAIAGLKKAHPDKEIGIIWIDAHADLHTPYTSPSGNMHGMPLAAALGMDNESQKSNDPQPITKDLWGKMKNLGGIQPKVKPEHIAFLGLRDFEKQERYLLETYDFTDFNTSQIREAGVEDVCQQVLTRLTDCDLIYLSFDVDSLDPSISRGTGTPVDGGLTVEEAISIIRELEQSGKIGILEITEVNPLLDRENKMAKTVVHVLGQIMD